MYSLFISPPIPCYFTSFIFLQLTYTSPIGAQGSAMNDVIFQITDWSVGSAASRFNH